MGSSWFLILTRASCWFHSVDYVLQLHITGPNPPFNSIEMIFKPELIWRENQSNCSNFLSIAGTWSSNWWTEAISPSICLRIQFRWPWKFWMLAWAAETCSAIAIVFIVIIMKFKISMCLQCQRVFVSICFGLSSACFANYFCSGYYLCKVWYSKRNRTSMFLKGSVLLFSKGLHAFVDSWITMSFNCFCFVLLPALNF